MKWFVYCGTTYYPWHEVIEADTASEAAERFGIDDGPIAVFPLETLAWKHAPHELHSWPDDGSTVAR